MRKRGWVSVLGLRGRVRLWSREVIPFFSVGDFRRKLIWVHIFADSSIPSRMCLRCHFPLPPPNAESIHSRPLIYTTYQGVYIPSTRLASIGGLVRRPFRPCNSRWISLRFLAFLWDLGGLLCSASLECRSTSYGARSTAFL